MVRIQFYIPEIMQTDIIDNIELVGFSDQRLQLEISGLEITGTSGNDDLTGASGDDYLLGKDGDDAIDGLLGDDVISGGAGDDYISDGSGYNYIDAGSGNDTLKYVTGEIDGGLGSDRIFLWFNPEERSE